MLPTQVWAFSSKQLVPSTADVHEGSGEDMRVLGRVGSGTLYNFWGGELSSVHGSRHARMRVRGIFQADT